ncbi:hypothetical protein EDI_093550 [Entamoeba dispar SAW760]|uniref:Uncharacterized protein n=1 Tax=Entamoeba dispar (strain ATCC PRA-260 / SAW760) TaxID=370354 RepID=B0EDE7_ENTDS|nr:uncharacterized protein EDI_093550 [Entamoeba dispar SAW760]EDR27564.1 hypothetical protein EDI_093550 [Entamoeba dispar SAW760]|eukprot:EDR27564.1 hypothetical protein EDI_093550 [Entamoeba dispar SAW760]
MLLCCIIENGVDNIIYKKFIKFCPEFLNNKEYREVFNSYIKTIQGVVLKSQGIESVIINNEGYSNRTDSRTIRVIWITLLSCIQQPQLPKRIQEMNSIEIIEFKSMIESLNECNRTLFIEANTSRTMKVKTIHKLYSPLFFYTQTLISKNDNKGIIGNDVYVKNNSTMISFYTYNIKYVVSDREVFSGMIHYLLQGLKNKNNEVVIRLLQNISDGIECVGVRERLCYETLIEVFQTILNRMIDIVQKSNRAEDLKSILCVLGSLKFYHPKLVTINDKRIGELVETYYILIIKLMTKCTNEPIQQDQYFNVIGTYIEDFSSIQRREMAQILIQFIIAMNDHEGLIHKMIEESIKIKKVFESKWNSLLNVLSIVCTTLYVIEVDPNKKLGEFIEKVVQCITLIIIKLKSLLTRGLMIKYLHLLITLVTLTPEVATKHFTEITKLFNGIVSCNCTRDEIDNMYKYYLYYFYKAGNMSINEDEKELIKKVDMEQVRVFGSKDRLITIIDQKDGSAQCVVRNWTGTHSIKIRGTVLEKKEVEGTWERKELLIKGTENGEVPQTIKEYLEKKHIKVIKKDQMVISIQKIEEHKSEPEKRWNNSTISTNIYNMIGQKEEKCIMFEKEELNKFYKEAPTIIKLNIKCKIVNEKFNEIMKGMKEGEEKEVFDEMLGTKIIFRENSFCGIKRVGLAEFEYSNKKGDCVIYINAEKEGKTDETYCIIIKEVVGGIYTAIIEKTGNNEYIQTGYKHPYSIISSVERELTNLVIENNTDILFINTKQFKAVSEVDLNRGINALEGSILSREYAKSINEK